MAFDTHCLFSTIRNVSGGRLILGFLPPHGRELANNEEFTLFGNILDAVAHRNGDRVTSRRHIRAFEDAINRGDIVIVQTPNPIFKDATTGAIKMARTNSGTLGLADPCWANEGSVVDDVDGGNQYDG
jgi:hypothetical protein